MIEKNVSLQMASELWRLKVPQIPQSILSKYFLRPGQQQILSVAILERGLLFC